MDKQLPDLYPLSPDQIQQLIDDLRLIQEDNAKILYAIDPFEISDFCFPVDPTSQTAELNIRALADDQAALFEVFYRQRPLLLSEYSNEVRRTLAYFENTADQLRDKSEMVDRIIAEGKLVWGDTPHDKAEAQATFLKENFNIILAIAMGIYSLGVVRLKDIYHSRLIKDNFVEALSKDEAPILRKILRGYERTEHWELMLKQLSRPLRDFGEGWVDRDLRADEVDASAIDHLIYLNSAFEKARLANELNGRYLILYLSSAPKTVRVFTRESVPRFLPTVRGAPYNFWRTRNQVFAYVVHKSREGNHSESIANLERVRDVLGEVRKFEDIFSSEDCRDCVLRTGSPPSLTYHQSTCRWSDFCQKVKGLDDEIQRARAEVHNLGLMNALSDYETLRTAKPRGESQRQYLSFFMEAFDSPLTRNARTRMERLQRWIFVKSEFTNSFTEALGVGKAGFDQSALRSGEDFVTGLDQYLPTKPRLSSDKYRKILELILKFYRDPTRVELVEDAYKRYVELDTETRATILEHELIRCFLYLALPRTPQAAGKTLGSSCGDEKAYEHAEAIMEGNDLLDREEWDTEPESMKQEYRYVQCWAARRIGRFSRAVELANQGISSDSCDPRFFHGLCLNIYSWLTKRPEECSLTIEDAIRAAQNAIRLYLDNAKDRENYEVVAANYNNLAYFWAWSVSIDQEELSTELKSPRVDSQDALACAREALDHLKNFIAKGDWEKKGHPEFFHTEAYLEYKEFMVALSEGDRIKAHHKLTSAKREIDKAVKIFEEGPGHEEYRKLRDTIDRGLEMFG